MSIKYAKIAIAGSLASMAAAELTQTTSVDDSSLILAQAQKLTK